MDKRLKTLLCILAIYAVVIATYFNRKDFLSYSGRVYHFCNEYSNKFKTNISERTNDFYSENSVSRRGGIDNISQQYMGQVSDVIVQYGAGRTATTLQFEILCLMMVMLHEEEADVVGCYFNRKPSHKYAVIKTHNISFLLKLSQNASIFMTARSKTSIQYILNKLDTHNRTVRYIVYTDMVTRRGHFIAYEYQSMLWKTNVSKLEKILITRSKLLTASRSS